MKDPALAELFIVEGDSAGGSGKQARDRNTQAVLPLRGKIINVEKNRIDKVLSNEEIQALVTAIGTGIREEFDPENLRYHKVILMTDADVDGAHIRTLVLTFLFREMQGLIEAGHVYIAKPPLYRLKAGSKEQYIEKESELEEVLLRDKLDRIEVFDHAGTAFKLTQQRWQRLTRLVKEYEGWASALRAEHGHDVITFLEESAVLDQGLTDVDKVVAELKKKAPAGEPYDTEVLSQNGDGSIRIKVIERKSGLATTHALGSAIFDSREYRQLIRVHQELQNLAGTPPFKLKLGRRRRRGAVVRGPAHQGAGARQARRAAAAVQGPRRDERRPAARDHDGPGVTHADAGDDRRRLRRRRAVLDADGRPGRTTTRLYREARARRAVP